MTPVSYSFTIEKSPVDIERPSSPRGVSLEILGMTG
jgi:hypothetical protein